MVLVARYAEGREVQHAWRIRGCKGYVSCLKAGAAQSRKLVFLIFFFVIYPACQLAVAIPRLEFLVLVVLVEFMECRWQERFEALRAPRSLVDASTSSPFSASPIGEAHVV